MKVYVGYLTEDQEFMTMCGAHETLKGAIDKLDEGKRNLHGGRWTKWERFITGSPSNPVNVWSSSRGERTFHIMELEVSK